MYMMIGVACFGLGFLLSLNRRYMPAAVALLLLGVALGYAQLSSQP
jgi:hypothetical protein